MGFSLKQKFYILAASAGFLLAIVSIIGSYNSYNTLKDSVQLRLIASVDGQGRALEGWLQTKAVAARGTANLITAMEDNEAVTNMSEILALADKDEDILDIAIGKEDTFFQGRHAGDKTGEIDLIGVDGDYLVFFEVKYRAGDSKGMASEAVNFAKMRQISKVAERYLYTHGLYSERAVRFDVIAIDGDEIEWYKNAFDYVG